MQGSTKNPADGKARTMHESEYQEAQRPMAIDRKRMSFKLEMTKRNN